MLTLERTPFTGFKEGMVELNSQPSFDAVIDWISHNPDFMFDLYNTNVWGINDPIPEEYRDTFSFEITYLQLNWNKRISNSHSCPRGGVENFTGTYTFKDGTPKPNGYPGWEGRVEYALSHDLCFNSRMTGAFGMHTGTGGGRGNRCGFGVRFFAADWPNIAKDIEAKQEAHTSEAVMARLADRYHPIFHWGYQYGEPKYFK